MAKTALLVDMYMVQKLGTSRAPKCSERPNTDLRSRRSEWRQGAHFTESSERSKVRFEDMK